MASTTKLMTALLVLEHGHLDDLTTVSYKPHHRRVDHVSA